MNNWRTSSYKGGTTFLFLNHLAEIGEPNNQGIGEGWNDPNQSKLWLYNLHYFDYLNAKGADKQSEQLCGLVDRWIDENPPGSGNGWEPYPISLRGVNIIKWFLSGHSPQNKWLDSLANQIRYLFSSIEYHILGNHIFANGKALVFAGIFFQGEEAEQWLSKGLAIIRSQVKEQILEDGGHFERSPMYHSLILEDMLDLCNLVKTYKKDLPPELNEMVEDWEDLILKMRRWLFLMSHPDGDISFFNDAAFKIAPTLQTLNSYAVNLKQPKFSPPAETLTILKNTGYVNVKQSHIIALLNVGSIAPDYQAGHAHADTLSFEMSLFGQRVFVNSGISQYGTDAERLRQRGTLAHNTVTINEENSSEVWSGFRVGRRARCNLLKYEEMQSNIYVSACHDGYQWMSSNLKHRRDWNFKNGALFIEDRIEGPFHKAVAMLHLSPVVQVESVTTHHARLRLPEGQSIDINCQGGEMHLNKGSWHSEFGISQDNQNFSIQFFEPTLKLNMVWG